MHTHPTSEVWARDELLKATRQGVEIWRAIPGTDKYEVSNQGRARSWAVRARGNHRATEPRILTCTPQTTGYPVIQILSGGKRQQMLLSVAICEAFIGPRPSGEFRWDCGHYDDDRANNVLTNLRWCTKGQNQRDRYRTGRYVLNDLRESREIGGAKHWCCTACKAWKPEGEFSPLKSSASVCGRASNCKPCAKAKGREAARARRAARGAKPRARRVA